MAGNARDGPRARQRPAVHSCGVDDGESAAGNRRKAERLRRQHFAVHEARNGAEYHRARLPRDVQGKTGGVAAVVVVPVLAPMLRRGSEEHRRVDFPPVKEVGVVAHLAELHDEIHEVDGLLVARSERRLQEIVQGYLIAHALVQVALPRRELAHDLHFNLLCEFVLDILLDSPEHKGLQNHVQPRELVLVKPGLLLGVTLNVLREPLVELLVRVKQTRHDKVQQRPQLGHAVLDWRAGEQQAIAAIEVEQRLPAGARAALDCLRLVEDHVLPADALKILLVRDHQLIARDQDVEGGVARVELFLVPVLAKYLALAYVAPVRQHLESRGELLKLLLPVVQRRRRRHDKEGTPDVHRLGNVREEADALDRLPEAHFVGEDSVDALLVEAHEPAHPLQLVRLERPLEHARLGEIRHPLQRRRIRKAQRLVKLFLRDAQRCVPLRLRRCRRAAAIGFRPQALRVLVELAGAFSHGREGLLCVRQRTLPQRLIVFFVLARMRLRPGCLGRSDSSTRNAAEDLVRFGVFCVVGRALELFAHEVRVQLRLRDEKVELSLLPPSLAPLLLLFPPLRRFLLRPLLQLALLLLVALPEHEHLPHEPLRARRCLSDGLGCGLVVAPHLALHNLRRTSGDGLKVGAVGRRILDSLGDFLARNLRPQFPVVIALLRPGSAPLRRQLRLSRSVPITIPRIVVAIFKRVRDRKSRPFGRRASVDLHCALASLRPEPNVVNGKERLDQADAVRSVLVELARVRRAIVRLTTRAMPFVEHGAVLVLANRQRPVAASPTGHHVNGGYHGHVDERVCRLIERNLRAWTRPHVLCVDT
eukprot:Opistho-1_new@19633